MPHELPKYEDGSLNVERHRVVLERRPVAHAEVVAALVRGWGGEPTLFDIARDDAKLIQSRIAAGAQHDLLITLGGASVGGTSVGAGASVGGGGSVGAGAAVVAGPPQATSTSALTAIALSKLNRRLRFITMVLSSTPSSLGFWCG